MVTAAALRRATGLLAHLAERDIRLWIEGDRLRCSAPAGAMSEPLRQALRTEREALIELLGLPNAVDPPLARRTPDDPCLTTLAQEALLPLARIRRDDGTYNVPLALDVRGRVDLEVLNEALSALQARHEALRTYFPEASSGPAFRPAVARISPEDEWTLADGVAEPAIRAAIGRPFDLAHGPLWRYGIFHLTEERTALLFVFHHLVFDGMSRDPFLAELAEQYSAVRTGRPAHAVLPFQSSDFAIWERRLATGTRAEAARAWWRARFEAPCPSTALPTGPEGEPPGSRHIAIAANSMAALQRRATAARQPASAIALTASVLALHRITGQAQILAMTPLANRDQHEALGIIGYLNRMVPIPIAIDRTATPAEIAAALATVLFEANSHRSLPTAEIVGLPGLARSHVNRLLFSWQERRRVDVMLDALPARERPLARHGADFGLALQFESDGHSLACRIDRAEGVLGEQGAAVFGELLARVIDAITGDGWERTVADMATPLVDTTAIGAALVEHIGITEAVAALDANSGLTTAWVVLDEVRPVSHADLVNWLRQRFNGLVPPIRLVSRATLPRSQDGAVDVAALRTAERHDCTVAEPPRSDLERLIAERWQRILWLDRPVGRDEDFRQLGGHSLLAVRMIADLEATFARPLGWRIAAGLSTVAALAAAIETGEEDEPADTGALAPDILSNLRAYTASWHGTRPFDGALIVGRNRDGARTPLFWCLQNESELDQLARYIGADQPIYGMRSGHAVMVKSRENIDRLAARYAADVMRAAPDGPLFLGGNCQAAVIAFQVARHAQAAGREVALLILHEKVVPEPYVGRIALSFGRESTRNPYRSSHDPHADLSPYYAGPFSIDLVSGAHGEFFREPNILDLVAMIRRRRDESPPLARPDAPGPDERGGYRVQPLA